MSKLEFFIVDTQDIGYRQRFQLRYYKSKLQKIIDRLLAPTEFQGEFLISTETIEEAKELLKEYGSGAKLIPRKVKPNLLSYSMIRIKTIYED